MLWVKESPLHLSVCSTSTILWWRSSTVLHIRWFGFYLFFSSLLSALFQNCGDFFLQSINLAFVFLWLSQKPNEFCDVMLQNTFLRYVRLHPGAHHRTRLMVSDAPVSLVFFQLFLYWFKSKYVCNCSNTGLCTTDLLLIFNVWHLWTNKR